MVDIYKNFQGYNPNKKRKLLIVYDDMIADMLSNKKRNPIVTELFIRGRKLNISLVSITQSYFPVPKDLGLNSMLHFIMKIPNKRELKQIASRNSSDIDFQDFMNLYKKCTEKPYSFLVIDNTMTLYKKCTEKLYSFLVIDNTLASVNPLHFRKKSYRKNIKTNHDNR